MKYSCKDKFGKKTLKNSIILKNNKKIKEIICTKK